MTERILTISTRDVMQAHSALGQIGWELIDGLPEWAPKRAIGTYIKSGRVAVLLGLYGDYVLETKR